jgi:hypothetical protein
MGLQGLQPEDRANMGKIQEFCAPGANADDNSVISSD